MKKRIDGAKRLEPQIHVCSMMIKGATAVFAAAALFATAAHADQYRSETRELPKPPPKQQKSVDPVDLLKSVNEPYAKALLLRDLAAAAAGRKDFAEAAKYLEQVLALNKSSGVEVLSGPALEELQKNLTQLYMASGNYKKLVPQLEQQVKNANAPVESLVALGSAYMEEKRYREAIPLLRRALAASKKPDPSWKRALLSALLETGQEKEALPLLEEAVRENPRDGDSWRQLIALTLKGGNKPKALGYMELAARLGHLETEQDRLRLASLTLELGAPFEAGSLLQAWIKDGQVKANAANWRFLASSWVQAREKKLALPALEEAADNMRREGSGGAKSLRELLETKAQLLMEREQYARAAQTLTELISLGTESGPVWQALAMARYQQADIDGALEAFRRARSFPQARASAEQWIAYLENNAARDEAMLAAAERAARARDDAVRLSGRLLGGRIEIAAEDYGTAVSGVQTTGDPFTPVGAERPGNADGTIPPWTGGLQKSEIPAAYKPGDRLVDPFPNERPQFVIAPGNAAQHRDKLSRGHQALLAKYPGYTMPVYSTRRTASYAQEIYDATQANIGRARLLGSDALAGARLGFPFPRPQSGVEVMWNHRVRYRGDTAAATYTQAVVRPDGGVVRNKQTFRLYFRYGNLKDPVDIAQKNILVYGITHVSESGRSPDFLALFHETANSIEDPRNIWVLIVKLGRMLRIPPVGYDQPFPASEGLEFIDMVDMYNGAFDRYVWKLVGKRELYIPYNAYRLSDGSVKYKDLLKPNHPAQEAARYELHRVWVIEATERGGKKHAFGKRTFYVDEDSWNAVLVENEDRNGNLWRFQEGHLAQTYQIQSMNSQPTYTYDLRDGRYFANRLFAEDAPVQYDVPMTDTEFLPAPVKARYSR
jgi:tetratricopeptide (TPR) repeat protein